MKTISKTILATLFSAMLIASSTMFIGTAETFGSPQNNSAGSIQAPPSNGSLNASGPVSILTVGNGVASNAVGNALRNLGQHRAASSVLNVNEAASYQLVLMDSGTTYSASQFHDILTHQTAVAIVGGNQLNGLSSVLLNNALLLPSGSSSKQSASLALPSDVAAFAVLLHPQNGPGNRYPASNFVFQGSFDPSKIAKSMMEWILSVRNTPTAPPRGSSPTGSPPDPEPSFSPNAPTFIGNTRWITNSIADSCGPLAAMQQVRMDYWYTATVTNGQTYYWIMQYAQHVVEGFSNSPSCYVWVPTSGSEYVDAKTTTWAGQQLANWDPGNGGTGSGNGNPVSYSIGVGPGGPSASVTFSQSGVQVNWSVSGNPAAGTLTWSNGYGAAFNPSASNTLLFTQPSEILELNPTLYGGVLPFIDSNSFTATFCAQAIGGWCSPYVSNISTPTISFDETIYTNSISYIGNPWIEIYAYPTTDTYARSLGLAIDRSLPVPWWSPYQSGYEIASQSGTLIYYTSPSLSTGSHYVQFAASGFVPNYAWHAQIYVNGALVAQGDVGRNQILTANFST